MKKFNIGELVLLIMSITVGIVICSAVLGMVFEHSEVNQYNVEIRDKLLDIIEMIAGAVIGVVATILTGNNKRKDEDNNQD